ncbi:MAG: hypothetical protein CMH04_00730 [Marinovum sp.]|nr:hypothetical protein [Marinovum sp.]|tara:strand:+ start:2683 stop:3249 length:567 start_codon:yes stop_codon:yes gene_type:complete
MTSIIKADNISTVSGSGTLSVASGTTLHAPGHVLQVKQTYMQTQVIYSTNNSMNNVPELNCTITPKLASSKIFVTINFNYSCSTQGCGHGLALDREIGGANSGDIARGIGGTTVDVWTGLDNNFGQANSSGIVMNACGNYLDSPNTTSAITYKPKVWIINGASPIKMNRSDSGAIGAASTMTLMEIAQ